MESSGEASARATQSLEAALAESLAVLELTERRLLVAVSGGLDSTVLAHALHALAGGEGLGLTLGHVNHGLRGADSDADEAAVRSFAARLSLPLEVERVDPAREREACSSRERPTLQEAARSLRRRALETIRSRVGADSIVTAHHADDQAETVLMRLARGCSPDSLGGIAERSPDLRTARPVLGIPRSDLLAYAHACGLSWREDTSNTDPRYTRTRVRERWLPALASDLNPQLSRALGHLAEAQRRDSEWLESLVDEETARRFRWSETALCIEVAGFDELPEALARRLVRRALIEMGVGRDLTRVHLFRALTFCKQGRPGARVELPGGVVLERNREEVHLTRC